MISWFNLLFGASIGKDNLNPFLILSYSPFVIFILSFWWVRIILSWLALKCLFCPLSIHHSCSPSIDFYFLHNSSSSSLLFDTDPTPIPIYNHFFLNLLNFLFFFLIIYFVLKLNLKRDETKSLRFSYYYLQQRQLFVLIEETMIFFIEL